MELFFDKIPSESKIRKYICNHLENHYIYFCDLPQNILAFTIHSGNIYLKGNYLYEYYNEKEENLLLIREKIILNIGHEIMHVLMRKIDKNMKNNFLIKSNQNIIIIVLFPHPKNTPFNYLKNLQNPNFILFNLNNPLSKKFVVLL